MDDQIWYLAGTDEKDGLLHPDYELGGDTTSGLAFGPLRKINIFVGPNNSGKSRLLRRIFSKGYFQLGNTQGTNIVEVVQEIETLIERIQLPSETVKIYSDHGAPTPIRELLADCRRTNFYHVEFLEISSGSLLNPLKAIFRNSKQLWDASSNSDFYKAMVLRLVSKTNERTRIIDKEDILSEIKEIVTILKLICKIATMDRDDYLGTSRSWESIVAYYKSIDQKDIKKLVENCDILVSANVQVVPPAKALYIPVLRSLHRLWGPVKPPSKNDDGGQENADPRILRATVNKNYRHELVTKRASGPKEIRHESIEVFTGQELFHKIVEARNGEGAMRKQFEDFEKFISEQFFSGRKFDIVARIGDLSDPEKIRHAIMEQSIQINIESVEFPIHKVGDGIQSLIMLTFPIFMAEQDSFIYIEEPEINLHPGMQRIFLEVISKNERIKEKNLTFFMTTHSNHFLDLTLTEEAPVSIFTIRRKESLEANKPHFEIHNVHSSERGILEQLGVQNSSVFIGNCSIWVEGVTDRKYIKLYLQAYAKKYRKEKLWKEDLHYVFFEYSGSNLSHYTFKDDDQPDVEEINAMRLSNRILALADRDDKKQAKHEFFAGMTNENFYYRQLQCAREIENLLDRKIVEAAIPKMFPRLKNNIDNIKWENLDKGEYESKPLYLSIRKVIGQKVFNEEYPQSTKSTTLPSKAKRILCEFVCSMKDFSWDMMTKEAQTLTKDIYQFIASSNGIPSQFSRHSEVNAWVGDEI